MEFGKKTTPGGRKTTSGFKITAGPADPLAGVEDTGSLEEDAAAELTELQKAYRDRAAREVDRNEFATDSEFWLALCFKDRASKEKFLDQLLTSNRKRFGDKYLDGHMLAKVLGFTL